jgi:hypothetical protein
MPIVVSGRLSYGVTAARDTGGAAEVAPYLATNVNLVTRPARPWHSTTAGGNFRLTLSLGSSMSVLAVIIANVTGATQLRVEAGDDGTTWPVNLGLQTLVLDQRTNQYKLFLNVNFTRAYIRISAEGVASGTTVSISTIWVAGSGQVRTWGDATQAPLVWTIQQAAQLVPFEGGGKEVNQDGSPYLRGTPGNENFILNSGNLTDFLTAAGVGKGVPFVWFDNLGDASQFVIGQRDEDVNLGRTIATFSGSIAIEEYAA